MMSRRLAAAFLALTFLAPAAMSEEKKPDAAPAPITVDKEKRQVIVAAKIAPRKINDPSFTEIYPIEVVACWAFPKGQKAHETVITIEAKPSDVHKALESLGLKAGKPALPGGDNKAEGPELKLSLDLGGKVISIEKALVDRKTGKTMPALKWHFTGSAMKQVDPNKPDLTYGADVSLTLISVFPVTSDLVIQSNLTMKDEPLVKMDTNKSLLPTEGTNVKLIIAPVK